MSSLFDALVEARGFGWNFSTMLVKAYLDERGMHPVGLIADACALSVRTVERALAVLKQSSSSEKSFLTTLSHDHDKHNKISKSTTTGMACVAGPDKTGLSAIWATDPLAERLLACEVLPWCVEIIMTRVQREVIERQLDAHAWRLKTGYPFKSHPARFLFRACLNDYALPDVRTTVASEPQAFPLPEPVPAVGATMTREGALNVIRMGLRSRLPVMREEALRLARAWDIDVSRLRGEALTGALA